MKNVKIKPLSSKKETIWILLLVLIILGLSYVLINSTRKEIENQSIKNNQISAYNELSNINNSFYSDILNSLVEIELIYEENNEIPNIDVLEEEELSPFVKDNIWENRGSLKWSKGNLGKTIYYIGLSQDLKTVGNFLILFSSDIEKSRIFYNDEKLTNINITLENINSHWKEILPYTGKDERRKY